MLETILSIVVVLISACGGILFPKLLAYLNDKGTAEKWHVGLNVAFNVVQALEESYLAAKAKDMQVHISKADLAVADIMREANVSERQAILLRDAAVNSLPGIGATGKAALKNGL